MPAGYEPGPVAGTLVHLATGLIVADNRTGAFDVLARGWVVVPPPAAPSDVLDLTSWYLTTPEPGAPIVLDLASYTLPGHFYADGSDVVLSANCGGGTTEHSSYPRCELREMDGSDLASWSTTAGAHEFAALLAVMKVPPVKPQVVMSQLHDRSRDVVEVMYDGTKPGGAIVVRHLGKQRPIPLMQPYALGTFVEVRMRVAQGRIEIFLDGRLVDTLKHRGDGMFSRFGAYVQSNPQRGDLPDAVGEVRIRRLDPPRHTD